VGLKLVSAAMLILTSTAVPTLSLTIFPTPATKIEKHEMQIVLNCSRAKKTRTSFWQNNADHFGFLYYQLLLNILEEAIK